MGAGAGADPHQEVAGAGAGAGAGAKGGGAAAWVGVWPVADDTGPRAPRGGGVAATRVTSEPRARDPSLATALILRHGTCSGAERGEWRCRWHERSVEVLHEPLFHVARGERRRCGDDEAANWDAKIAELTVANKRHGDGDTRYLDEARARTANDAARSVVEWTAEWGCAAAGVEAAAIS